MFAVLHLEGLLCNIITITSINNISRASIFQQVPFVGRSSGPSSVLSTLHALSYEVIVITQWRPISKEVETQKDQLLHPEAQLRNERRLGLTQNCWAATPGNPWSRAVFSAWADAPVLTCLRAKSHHLLEMHRTHKQKSMIPYSCFNLTVDERVPSRLPLARSPRSVKFRLTLPASWI